MANVRVPATTGTLGALIFALTVAACDRIHGDGINRDGTDGDRTGGNETIQAGTIYGRIVTEAGAVHAGLLRWGGDEEALWSNYFNGAKSENPWVVYAPREHKAIRVLGRELFGWDREPYASRPFMARFGDIARIELRGRDIQVILKNGTSFHVARYGADDMNDGVRVWDDSGRFVNVSEWGISTIEFLPTPERRTTGSPLYGTVHTRTESFTGLIQWDRRACMSLDEFKGIGSDGETSLRFEAIRSITRRADDSSLITLTDGREMTLFGPGSIARNGIYVDDPRYGRVLVSSEAFERVAFLPVSASPSYDEYKPGRPLAGEITTRAGRRISGRLVFDLDESETTETLDAPRNGIDYMIPFSMITSIATGVSSARLAEVTLSSGEVLHLERSGDLGSSNGGMLVFIDGSARPVYVSWADVERIGFNRSN
jgi:hypothetical protein